MTTLPRTSAVILCCSAAVFAQPSLAQHAGHSGHAGHHDHAAMQAPSPASPPADANPAHHAPQQEHELHGQHGPHGQHTPVVAPPTDAERAAAFPAHLEGMDMRGHMDDDPWIAALHVDRLERDDAGGDAWHLRASLGKTFDRFVLSSEGHRERGALDDHAIEARWEHATGPWWDRVVALRDDRGAHGPSRQWFGIGARGTAPYMVHVDAMAWIGSGGRLAARVEADYDLRISQRVVLQPKVEAWAHGEDDRANGIGRGLSRIESGLRLRYEITPAFAPYFGYAHERRLGRTRDLVEADGGNASEGRWVVGIRAWF